MEKNLVNNFVSSYTYIAIPLKMFISKYFLKIVIIVLVRYLSFINYNRKIETILSRESYLYLFIGYHFEIALLHDLVWSFFFIVKVCS